MKNYIKNPQIAAKVAHKISLNKFSHHIGLQYTELHEGRVLAELPMQEHLEQQNGYLHGGLVAMLCDTVAGFAAYTDIGLTEQVVTGELKVSYFYPVVGEIIYARGWVVKGGKRIQFCESEVYVIHNGQERVCAKATTTMVVI